MSANIELAADEIAIPISAGAGLPRTAAGGTNVFSSVESVSEVEFKVWSYPAEFSQPSGRQILSSTKSGTNNFHGSLFEGLRNSLLNANDWLGNSRGFRKPVSPMNNFGGSFGGPIVRNESFFFLSYEGLRLRHPAFVLTDVPSFTARNNSPSGIQPLLKAFPLPTGPARDDQMAEFASTFNNSATADTANLRLDSNVTDTIQIRGRYSYANSYATTRGSDGFSLNTLKRTDSNIQTINGHAIYSSSNAVLDFASNYSRLTLGQSYGLDNFGGANVTATDARALFANGQTFSKFDLYGRNAVLASGNKIEGKLEQFNFVTSATVVKDNHTIKVGFDYRRLWLVTGAQPSEQSVLFDGINGALSGTTARINLISRTGPQRPRLTNFSVYAQDSWKISPKFTFNFGARWEVDPPPSVSEGQNHLTLANARLPFSANLASQGTPLWRTTYNNFAPRIGFAYQPDDDGKNLIRAGIGWFYDYGNTDAVQTFVHSSPFANGTVAFNQPLLSNNQTPNKAFIGYDPNLKLPFVRQWSLMFSRELSRGITLSATYLGAQGKRLHLTRTYVDQDPEFAFARLTTNEGKSSYQSFQLRFQTSFVKGFNSLLLYNFSKSLDNFSPDTIQRVIIASPNAQLDQSYSDTDARHSLSGYVSYSTSREFENKTASQLLRNWTFTSLLNLRSALPLNVVYGRVNNFGISYFRPDVNSNAPFYSTDANGLRSINPAAFSIPSIERQGTLARNSLRAFPFYQVDFSVSRKFNFTNDLNLTVRLSAVNVFNHPNFTAPSAFDRSLGTLFPNGEFLANSTFGQSSSLHGVGAESAVGPRFLSTYQPNAGRSLQLSFKFSF